MNESGIIELLEHAVRDPGKRTQRLRIFQEAVFQDESLTGEAGEILRGLAYDLDYYDPDPQNRIEEPSLYDEGQVLERIEDALRRRSVLSQG